MLRELNPEKVLSGPYKLRKIFLYLFQVTFVTTIFGQELKIYTKDISIYILLLGADFITRNLHPSFTTVV